MDSCNRLLRTVAIALAAALLASACGGGASTKAASARPAPTTQSVLTIDQLNDMLDNGEAISVIISRIQGSGTIYRLTTDQQKDLRANGMPAAIMSMIELGYQHAIQANPDLAKSDAQWHEIDGYWYGGTPFGWPRDWVVGAPAPGALLR